ncbi:MAG TPA: hypothetical protein VKE22_24050 [Haliangiales bacterium]|nr:hypothetical protein [Haliangiales bacterium]
MSPQSERELDRAFDELVARFGHGDDVAAARAGWAERTGRVFEEDELYEQRTISFVEWYACEHRLADGRTPVVVALAEPEGEHHAAWRAWRASHRSLYAVAARREGVVVLDDLVGQGRFAVDERRRLHGVHVGDVIEARLLGWRGRVRFGRTFCFHPAAALKAIVEHVRRILGAGGTRADAVDFVASLRVRALRYKHVLPERVYEAREPRKP